MQQREERGTTELKTRTPSAWDVVEAPGEQREDRDRSCDDREDRIQDGFARDRGADHEDLIHLHGSESALQVVLDVGDLRRIERRISNDVALPGLHDCAVEVLGVHSSLHLCERWIVGEADRDLGATGKVDAQQEAVTPHREDAGDDDQKRQREEQVPPADDVEAANPRRRRDHRRLLGLSVLDHLRDLLLRSYVRQFWHGPLQAGSGGGNRRRSARSRAGCA